MADGSVDIATLGIKVDATQADQAAGSLDKLTTAGAKAEASTDGLAAANAKLAASARQTISASAQQTAALNVEVKAASEAAAAARSAASAHKQMADAAGLNRLQILELTHSGRAFAEMLAAGQTPMRALITEAPRLAQALGTGPGGLAGGFKAAGAAVAGLVEAFPAIIPIAIGVVASLGAATLATRELDKAHGDLTKTMGLTEQQLKKLADQGVKTHITLRDTFVGTWDYIAANVDKNTQGIQGFVSKMLDGLTSACADALKGTVGLFLGAFDAIKTAWKELPAALGDIVLTTAQKIVDGITTAINLGIQALNFFGDKANAVAQRLGHAPVYSALGPVAATQVDNPYAGAAGRATGDVAQAFAQGARQGIAEVDKILKDLGIAISKAAEERIRKAAGDAGKPKAGAGDATTQKAAQVEQALAQAHVAELQAQLQLTHSIEARAQLQKQIIAAEAAVKDAEITRQEAELQASADHKAISQATADELKGKLETVRQTYAHVAILQQQNVDAQTAQALVKQSVDLAEAQLEGQQQVLSAQAQGLKSTYARTAVEAQILQIERQYLDQEQRRIDGLAADDPSRAVQQQTLDNRRAVLNAEIQVKNQDLSLAKGVEEAVGSVHSFADAIKRHDWLGAFDSLMSTLQTVNRMMEQMGASDSGGGNFLGGLGKLFGLGGGSGSAGSNAFDLTNLSKGLGFLGGSGENSFSGSLEGLDFSLDSLRAGVEKATAGVGTGASGGGFMAQAGAVVGGYAIGQAVGNPVAKALGINQGAGAQVGSAIGSAIGMAVGGPIGAAIGAFLGDLAGGLFDNKPTNGAGIDAISQSGFTHVASNKTTPQGAQMADAFAAAVLNSEAALKAAGITLQSFVSGIDIGTRDVPNVTFSDGRQERLGAIGDPASAADAAMKELLQGATYVDDAQKKLVDSMLAAGKGFDEIATSLQAYAAAQKVGQQISDAILQLTDPQAYDTQQVKTGIQAQRDALQASADAGYYTAEQFAALNAQLDTLQGLQLDEVLKKYADAATQATNQWKNVAQSLADWLAALTGQTATPAQSTQQSFAALQAAGLAGRNGDLDAAGKVTNLANAYLAAGQASASSRFEYLQDVARARAVVSSVQLSAAHFATGGSFTVGGSGGADSQFVPLMLSPGETGNISRADTMAQVVTELRAVKAQLASLQADNRAGLTKLASNTGRAAKLLETWDGAGLPPDRDAEQAA